MTRILLINPPSREALGSPLLGQQYVAAALRAGGSEVRVLDAAARCRRAGVDDVLAAVDDFRPDVAAFGLFTRWVWHAYQAATALRGKVRWLIAGGPHATARPREALEQGFDVALAGEAEHSAIRKGISTAQVEQALLWAKELGLMTSCNFMMGFPQETPVALENTRRFMERIAPQVDYFSTLGVVVPYPATPIYEDFHVQYGFTNWWLDERYSRYTVPPSTADFDRFRQFYIDDANLDLDFFRYSDEMRVMIRESLRYKAEHNLRKCGSPVSLMD